MNFKEFLREGSAPVDEPKSNVIDDCWDVINIELERFNESNPKDASYKSTGTQNGVVYYFKSEGGAYDFVYDVAAVLEKEFDAARISAGFDMDIKTLDGRLRVIIKYSEDDDSSHATIIIK
jgi:hypothetical protein